MRKPVLALAAAGSVFALTAAGAAGVLTASGAQKSLPTLAKQSVTLNTCAAGQADFTYGTSTTEDATYGKIDTINLIVSDTTSADLDNCDNAVVTVGGETYTLTFGAVAGSTTYTRTATITTSTNTDDGVPAKFAVLDSLSTISAVITGDFA